MNCIKNIGDFIASEVKSLVEENDALQQENAELKTIVNRLKHAIKTMDDAFCAEVDEVSDLLSCTDNENMLGVVEDNRPNTINTVDDFRRLMMDGVTFKETLSTGYSDSTVDYYYNGIRFMKDGKFLQELDEGDWKRWKSITKSYKGV